MKYILLIATDEAHDYQPGQPGYEEMMAGYGAFAQEVVASGAFQGGERLHPAASATTVRVRNGQRLLTDGPFAETREQLGGFFIVECKDLDEAVALAAKLPGAADGAVEVRPIMPM
jgi:hypothetical protein